MAMDFIDMDVAERVREYLRGYTDGYRAGMEYSLTMVRKIATEKGLLPDEEAKP